MNIKTLESYEDIEKIDSFIIVIKSPDKREDNQLIDEDQKILRKSLTQSFPFPSKQETNRLKSQLLKRSNNTLSIASRALQKISYRTQLNAKIQKHTLLKQKCEQLISRSPYKERCYSTNCQKSRSPKKDHLSWLNYNSNLQTKQKNSNNLSSTSLQESKNPRFPRLTIKPLEIMVKNEKYSERFILLKMLQNKENHNTYLSQCLKNNIILTLRIFAKETVSGRNRQIFLNEIKTQLYLNHSHIVKLYEVSFDNNFFYAFFEPGMNINLRQTLTSNGPLAERQVRKIIKQILLAVDYLHKQNLAHLNIRPESIYYHEDIAKLGQFNKIYNFTKNEKKKTSFNVSDFFFLEDSFLHSQYSDLWNIGILTYQLLYGHPPIKFNIKSKQVGEIDPQIFKGNQALIFNEEIDVSDKAKQFISICLDCKVSKKSSAKQLSQHGFLIGGEKYRWTTA